MKSFSVFMSVVLVIILMFSAVPIANAAEADLVPAGLCIQETDDGVKTMVSFTDDSRYITAGTVDYESTEKDPIIERIDSFTVSYENEVILTVEPTDIAAIGSAEALPNGYYAVSFPIPETTKECFVTGLTPQNASKTQEQLLAHYASGAQFSVEDLDYIDAEKLISDSDGDDLMCWAAAASNMLRYAGWGERAGFKSEDDIFEAMIDAFVDEPGFSENGVQWFMGGLQEGFEKLKNPETGGYLPEYDTHTLIEKGYFFCENGPDGTEITGLKEMIGHLKDGDAVGLSVSWANSDSSHVVTAWGCVTDNAYSDNLAAHYDSLIISDSDNNEASGTDRRAAPNTLDLYPLSEYEEEYSTTVALEYGYMQGILSGFVSLKPYAEDIPYETDERATKDHRYDPDFKVTGMSIQPFEGYAYQSSLKGYEGAAYLFASISNTGVSSIDGQLPVRLVVKNAEGSPVLEQETAASLVKNTPITSVCFGNLDQLTSGIYTAEIDVNPNGTFKESLLMNNHYSCEFEVVGNKPDVNEITFSAEIGAFSDRGVAVTMDYHDLEQTELYRQSDRVVVITSFFDGDQWSMESVDRMSSLQKEMKFYAPRSKVRFRLVFFQGDIAIATDPIEYDLPFPVVQFVPDGTDGFTRKIDLPSGARDLSDEREITFNLINRSAETIPQISGTLQLFVIEETTGNETALTEPEHVVLQNGVPSDTFTFSSWDEPLYGLNALQARFVDEDHDQYTIFQQIALLNAKEMESSVVTTADDIIDPYDCRTSLREAAAYCEDHGRTVTFSDEIDSVRLTAPILVDKTVSVDGLNNSEIGGLCVRINGRYITSLFDVDGGSLTLRNIVLSCAETGENGGAILCEGGALATDHVLFESCRAENGGGICFDGGTGRLKNTSFSICTAARGAAIYIDNNAQVDMLNCTVASACISYDGAVYNKSGRLNMISSAVIGCGVVDSELDVISAVCSEGETNIVNSILTDTFEPYLSASGNVHIYCSAVETVGEGVVTDALTKSYAPKQLIPSGKYYDMPIVIRDNDHAICYPELTPEAENGCLTSSVDGKLVIMKDGETAETGIDTPFTNEELHTDILGTQRESGVYGPCTKITDESVGLLGDANLDGAVDIADATTVQRYALKMTALSETALRLADVDKDSDVSIIDATWIQRWELKMKALEGIGQLLAKR